MIDRNRLTEYLDTYLRIAEVPDGSKNGLQVEGTDQVGRLAVAVDACMDTFEEAVAREAQMLLVHHGIFWEDVEVLTGYHYRRVKFLIEHGLNLYTAHLPLDVHPEVGNNAELARLLDLEVTGPFGDYKGLAVGVVGEARSPLPFADFVDKLQQQLGENARVDAFGPEKIARVGIVTGGGASLIPQAVEAELDCFITGEPKHSLYHFGKENRINLIFAGHYATETLGVLALAKHLRDKYQLETFFVDKPTGL